MTILFVTPTYKPAYIYGGVTVVTSLLAESLVKCGHEVTVYTTNGNGTTELKIKADQEVIADGVKVFYFKRFSRGHSHVSPAFWKMIYYNVKKFDIVHLHSWWNPPIMIAAAICKLRGVKPILSPHGMLCKYILNTNNRTIKKILHDLFGKWLLKNTFLHVSSEMEWNESQIFFKGNWPGAVIPNPVELKSIPVQTREDNNLFVLGFLSRIDPKKRLDLLIKALSRVNFKYELRVAGDGDSDYITYLKRLSVEYGNAHKIHWVGWKEGMSKYEFYGSIDLFVLLSFNENFGVVVIEALTMGTPVLLSREVALSKFVEERSLGWIIDNSEVNHVVETLDRIFQNPVKRLEIKDKAPSIVEKDLNINSLMKEYVEFYFRVKDSALEQSQVAF